MKPSLPRFCRAEQEDGSDSPPQLTSAVKFSLTTPGRVLHWRRVLPEQTTVAAMDITTPLPLMESSSNPRPAEMHGDMGPSSVMETVLKVRSLFLVGEAAP